MAQNDFQYGGWNSYTLQCGTITTLISSGDCTLQCGFGIVTVNSPILSGNTLQCDTWLWDDMPLNSPRRPPYWNSTSGFHFHTSPQSTCHSVPVCEILSKSDLSYDDDTTILMAASATVLAVLLLARR